MATLKRFENCKLCIYPDDHNPPHFHLEGPDWRASFTLSDLRLDRGSIPKGAKSTADDALAWANENQALLYCKWVELNERDDQG